VSFEAEMLWRDFDREVDRLPAQEVRTRLKSEARERARLARRLAEYQAEPLIEPQMRDDDPYEKGLERWANQR